MNSFRDQLKLQNLGIAFGCLILTAISILGATGILKPIASDSRWIDFWNGMIMGATFGVLLVMIACLIRNILALTSDARLKKLYVREKDERTLQIWTMARKTAYQTTILLELLAGIVAGYFSITVSLTIISCCFLSSMIGLGFAFYYHIKY